MANMFHLINQLQLIDLSIWAILRSCNGKDMEVRFSEVGGVWWSISNIFHGLKELAYDKYAQLLVIPGGEREMTGVVGGSIIPEQDK